MEARAKKSKKAAALAAEVQIEPMEAADMDTSQVQKPTIIQDSTKETAQTEPLGAAVEAESDSLIKEFDEYLAGTALKK